MSRTRDVDELIRRKALLGSQLTSKDKDYAEYAGGDYVDARKIAMVNFILKANLVPENLAKLLRLYKQYLDQRRKAFFSTVDADVLTKLAIIVGENRNVFSANERTIPIKVRIRDDTPTE